MIRMEDMIFPRLIALAEKGWTDSRNMDYNGFLKRMEKQYRHLDKLGVYYYDGRDTSRHPEPQR